MGRFSYEDAEKYGNSTRTNYFTLKNDRDKARVRFLYKNADDVVGMAVHKVKVGDYDRYVNCLREYNEPREKCPFCRERYQQQARAFIPVWNVEAEVVQVWERSARFLQNITGQMARYGKKGQFCKNIFEVERMGKAGDTGTTYGIYFEDRDDSKMSDFPEVEDVLENIVLDKSADEMEYYIEEGEFPPEDDEDRPVRRRGAVKRRDEEDDDDDDDDEEDDEEDDDDDDDDEEDDEEDDDDDDEEDDEEDEEDEEDDDDEEDEEEDEEEPPKKRAVKKPVKNSKPQARRVPLRNGRKK